MRDEALEIMAIERRCSLEVMNQMVCEAPLCTNETCVELQRLMAKPPPVDNADVAADYIPVRRPVLPLDAKSRNDYPLWDGLFAYFGSALCEVARLSKIANDQHNPGEPLHWARNKSLDHKNKILKHILDAELMDTDETLHATKLAWRALALLQTILEKRGAPVPPNAY